MPIYILKKHINICYFSHIFIYLSKHQIKTAMKKIFLLFLLHFIFCTSAQAKNNISKQLTLNMVIKIAQETSFDAQMARFHFISAYWNFRSYKAELLPSLKLSGNLLNFNRSLVEVRNPDNGKISYVNNNSLTNNLSLSIDQNLPFSGGTISVQSYIDRLDQFAYNIKTYNTEPFIISYTQPIQLYNELKWKKKIEPTQYKLAQKQYLEDMEQIAINTTQLFFQVLHKQSAYQQRIKELEDKNSLYNMAQKRFLIGTITKSEILQLELAVLNAQMLLNKYLVELENSKFNLFTYLQISDYQNTQLLPPFQIPEKIMNAEWILSKALKNSSHQLQTELTLLQSQKQLASIKAKQGLQITLRGKIGFSQTGKSIQEAYNKLQNNEIVGLSFSIPIYNWGIDQGKLQIARSELEITKTQIKQEQLQYIQDIKTKVINFNNQAEICNISQKAQQIAEERYEIMKKKFENGTITVSELNTSTQEKEQATEQYISQLESYWINYYQIQKASLYDLIKRCDIEFDFDLLTQHINKK